MNIEIWYGDIIIMDGKKQVTIKEAVFRQNATHYKRKQIVEVLSYKCVGYVNNAKGYTEVKKNDEQRNKITGAYE